MSRHGTQELVGSWVITHLDPILSLGHATTVTAMYRARKHGASPAEDCLLFTENGKTSCYRHPSCEALPAIDEICDRQAQERRAQAVGS